MSLINQKYEKLMDSVNKSLGNIVKGDKRAAVGDIHYIIDNARKIEMLLLAEIEDEEGT